MNAPELKEEEKFVHADRHLLSKKNLDASNLDLDELAGDFCHVFHMLSIGQHFRMKEKGFYDSFYRTREILIDQAKTAHNEWQWKVNDMNADQVEVGMLKIIYEQAQSDLLQYTTNFLLKQKCLFHEEISESASALRENDKADDKLPQFSGDAVECADAIIRILDYAGFRGIDVAGALRAKMQYNLSRPKMHGKNA